MSEVLGDRCIQQSFGAFVVAIAFDRAGHAAFALADGTVRMAPDWRVAQAHRGAALCLVADPAGTGFLSGGDDGRFVRTDPAGSCTERLAGRKWVEQAASVADGKTIHAACAAGRVATVFGADGKIVRELDHPSTVTGIAFDARGKRIAASHVNGASLWFTGSQAAARRLEWKGSHTAIAMHPDAQAVVTAMQENALHGWRLADGQHMRMSGYPAKTESLGFTKSGRWLVSSGADAIVLWPFFGGGPMGKPPTEHAQIEGVLVTRVAAHPQQELVAAGYANGAVLLVEIASGRVLPLRREGAPVSALGWSGDGAKLGAGGEDGWAALYDLGKRPALSA